MTVEELETQVKQLHRKFQAIDHPPATTLEILGESGLERHWESLLAYFLDPTKAHGFGTDVLEAFVSAVTSHPETTITGPFPHLTDVRVQTQVATTQGPVDLLIWVENEWYICVEMKVHADESGEQTIRYAEAPQIGSLVKREHGGQSEYVYLAPETAAPSKEPTFVDLSWRTLLRHFDVLVARAGEYPDLSRAQFSDYIETIKRELSMDEFDELSPETRLYAEYADTIEAVTKTKQSELKTLYQRLEDTFFAEFDPDRGRWQAHTNGVRYIQLYKPTWHSLEQGTDIEYEPHIKLDRVPAEIRLRLDIERGNKEKVRDELLGRVGEETIETLGWRISRGRFDFIRKPIPLTFENPNESIQEAVQELRVLHGKLGPTLDAVAEEFG